MFSHWRSVCLRSRALAALQELPLFRVESCYAVHMAVAWWPAALWPAGKGMSTGLLAKMGVFVRVASCPLLSQGWLEKLPRAKKAVSEKKGRGICCGAAANLSSEWSLLFLLQQDIDTAVVSDTTDDLWFLNECPSDQSSAAVKGETVDCEEVKEGDKKVLLQTAAVHVFRRLALFNWSHGSAKSFAFHLPFSAVLIWEELGL